MLIWITHIVIDIDISNLASDIAMDIIIYVGHLILPAHFQLYWPTHFWQQLLTKGMKTWWEIKCRFYHIISLSINAAREIIGLSYYMECIQRQMRSGLWSYIRLELQKLMPNTVARFHTMWELSALCSVNVLRTPNRDLFRRS